jgi:hypothetical protein
MRGDLKFFLYSDVWRPQDWVKQPCQKLATARQLGAAYSIDLSSADKHFRSHADHHCAEGALL